MHHARQQAQAVLGFLLMGAFVGASLELQTAAAQETRAEDRVAALAGEINRYIVEYAASRGYELAQGADFLLRQAAERAANDIVRDPQKFTTALAQKNLAGYLDQMISEAHDIAGYPAGRIGEQTYDAAGRKLCPLWPIC